MHYWKFMLYTTIGDETGVISRHTLYDLRIDISNITQLKFYLDCATISGNACTAGALEAYGLAVVIRIARREYRQFDSVLCLSAKRKGCSVPD